MAASPLNPKYRYHARSISLPSRPHSIFPQLEYHLSKLKSLEPTTSTTSSNKLASLKDLHDLVNNLLLLPLTQQYLTQECRDTSIDELLDGSLRILDLCNRVKDAISQTKEQVNYLQSVLRRRRNSDELQEYFFSRKNFKNTLKKAIKSQESNLINKRGVPLTEISMLREVEAVTLSVFKSLLRFVAGPKSSNWCLVSRMVKNQKRVSFDDQEIDKNELEIVDDALQSLARHKPDCLVSVENLQNRLRKLELSIQELEDGLESLYKCLIKISVPSQYF